MPIHNRQGLRLCVVNEQKPDFCPDSLEMGFLVHQPEKSVGFSRKLIEFSFLKKKMFLITDGTFYKKVMSKVLILSKKYYKIRQTVIFINSEVPGFLLRAI
jgi:hypothetical protein